MVSTEAFFKVYAETRAVYERQSKAFDEIRARDGREDQWLQEFAEALPAAGSLLDLGCGTGEPIASWFIARGFSVTGIDYSETMLAIARARFPNGTWLHQDMRELNIAGQFDGILSWHGSFHLSPDEQRALIPKLAGLLKPGGKLLLTIGPEAGEVTGQVGGETVYHASLDPKEYFDLLESTGFSDFSLQAEGEDGPHLLLAEM